MDTEFLRPGTLLRGGTYRIERALGQGGFGITYLAKHVDLGKPVAIKEFYPSSLCMRQGDTGMVSVTKEEALKDLLRYQDKFKKEARNIASLNHPNIVKVHDVFDENGTSYFVMDYYPGGSLSQLVQQRGRLPEAEARGYIRQLAAAVCHLHERKLNHLDIKPANVMLDALGQAVLIDFGISKHYRETGQATSTTPVGISEGYAPLEQYDQDGLTSFSPATDVYALGATYYKLLTGQTPPKASNVLNEGGIPLEPLQQQGVSEATIQLISHAMKPVKKERLSDAAAFLRMLDSQPAPMPPADDDHTVPVIDTEDEETVMTEPVDATESTPSARKEKKAASDGKSPK